MAIRDVSKQWAAMLESEAAEDREYSEACEEACKSIKKANEDEIDEFDEEVIDPSECGFTEADVECEAVDPLQMWKDMKVQQKPATVKVDSKYIDTMKKLLSKIKSSKAQLYNTVMKKLEAYKAAGIELPPPEDFAENFVPFEMIAKIAGGKEDKAEDHVDGDDDEKMLAGRAYATNRSAAELGDTDNPFGNADAEQNMYDSELTEEEQEDAKQKGKDALADAKKEVTNSSVESADAVKDALKDADKAVAALAKTDKESAEALKKLVKAAKKYADGEIKEDELVAEKKGNKSAALQFVKATCRLVVWISKLIPLGILGTAWVAKGIATGTKSLLDMMDKSLAEACTIECMEDEQVAESADAEEIAEDGVSVKECGEDKTEDGAKVEEAACKNQDDPATHLLDAAGVKASTASLKDKDAAMISVVEMLMKKIEKLETQLSEAQAFDLSKKEGSITSLFIAHKAEADATKSKEELTALVKKLFADAGIDTPASRRMVINFERSRSWLNSLTYFYNIIQKGSGNGTIGKMHEADGDEDDTSIDEIFDEMGLTKQQREDYEAAKKIQDISYRRELTKAEENRFRELFYKLPDLAHDYLLSNTMGSAGFARPGDVPLLDDPTVHPDDGGGDGMGGFKKANVDFDKKVPIPPFNYKQGSHRETAAEKRKQQKEEWKKQQAKDTPMSEIAWPKTGDDTWEVKAMNMLVGSLSDKQKKELMDGMIADIEAENKAVKDSGQLNAEELKELEVVNAEEKAFIKTIFTHKRIGSRELAPIFGMSHAGVTKAARTTLQMIRDTFKEVLGANIDLEKNPQDFMDACDEMSDKDWAKFQQLLRIKSEGRQNRKLMQGNDKEKRDALRAKIQAVKAELQNKKANEAEEVEEADSVIGEEETKEESKEEPK